MYPFKENSFAVKNAWYVAAFTSEVSRSLLSRNILNQPVVLYRKENGQAVAVSGRCPHRHFPLGKSSLKKDDIVCGYHGLEFSPEGHCTNIPTQDLVPSNCKITGYPTAELGLWVWIWPGDPELADESLLPDLGNLGFSDNDLGINDPEMTFREGFYIDVEGRYQLLNDNLMDLSHLAFLHASSIGTIDNAVAEEVREEKEAFLSSKRVMENVAAPAIMHDFHPDFEGTIDRISMMNSFLPGFHAGGEDIFISENHPTRAGEHLVKGRVFHAVTPGLKNTTNYFFAVGDPNPEGLEQLLQTLKVALDEDVFATEETEKMIAIAGEDLPNEVLLKSDLHAVRGRRILQAMMDSEQTD